LNTKYRLQYLYEPINKLDIVLWKNGESFLKVIHRMLIKCV
jgi:hypothetical protein